MLLLDFEEPPSKMRR